MATPNQLPAKSPILDKYRSRLQITYRTNISGTPVPSKLPFRVLVLGEFQGKDQRVIEQTELRARKILSIEMGSADASVAAFMKERTPFMRVPQALRKDLEAPLPGNVSLKSLSFSDPGLADGKSGPVNLVGTVVFSSLPDDKGVCVIGPTELPVTGTLSVTAAKGVITAAPKSQIKLMITGSLRGTILDNETRRPSGVITALFPAEGTRDDVSFDAELLAPIQQGESQCTVTLKDKTKTFSVRAVRTIPFQSLSAFSPDAVAASIPELHRLAVIRGLVLELQSTLRNNRPFAKAMKEALKSKDALLAFKKYADSTYQNLNIAQNPTGQTSK